MQHLKKAHLWPGHRTGLTASGRREGEQRSAPNAPSELSSHEEVQELVPVHNRPQETSPSLISNLKDERHLV